MREPVAPKIREMAATAWQLAETEARQEPEPEQVQTLLAHMIGYLWEAVEQVADAVDRLPDPKYD